MEIIQTITDGTMLITLRGRFTFMENTRFRESLQKLSKGDIRHVQIHLQELTFVDSAALGMLLLLHEEAQKRSIDVTLTGAQGQPEKMFTMARFDSIFSMVP